MVCGGDGVGGVVMRSNKGRKRMNGGSEGVVGWRDGEGGEWWTKNPSWTKHTHQNKCLMDKIITIKQRTKNTQPTNTNINNLLYLFQEFHWILVYIDQDNLHSKVNIMYKINYGEVHVH